MLASNPCHTKCGMWSAVSTLLTVRHTIGDNSCTVDDTGSTRTICKDKHLINLVCKTALSEVPLHYNSAEEIKCETFLTWIISSPNRSVVSEIVMLQIWRYLWYSFFFCRKHKSCQIQLFFIFKLGECYGFPLVIHFLFLLLVHCLDCVRVGGCTLSAMMVTNQHDNHDRAMGALRVTRVILLSWR